MVLTKRKGTMIGVFLSEERQEKLRQIVKHEYTNQSQLLRKWIDTNFKELFNDAT